MPLIYITGPPGTGKSTVCAELKRRGYTAYDTDKDSIAFFYNNTTGEAVTEHVPSVDRTPTWREQHSFKAKRETIERLRKEAEQKTVFLCGVTSNDADELWDIFDTVFALVITDEHILRERILNRTEDGYGKNPHEFAALLKWQKTAADDYTKLGAILIDASKPLSDVVDDILARASAVRD